MKKSKKIFIAAVLCALVLLSVIPASALNFDLLDGPERNIHFVFIGSQHQISRTMIATARGNVLVGSPSGSQEASVTFLDFWKEDNGDVVAYSDQGEIIRYYYSESGIRFRGATTGHKFSYAIILCDTLEVHNQELFDLMFGLDPSSSYNQGYSAGFITGESAGYSHGLSEGYEQGMTVGYQDGYDAGYAEGASAEYTEGYQDAYNEYYPQISASYNRGYNEGFAIGKAEGVELSETDFFDLCFAVAQAPIDVLYGVFDFEILGFNMQTAIGSLATVCIVVFLVKFLLFFLG